MIVEQDVIVKPETHTKITCKCPECGQVFDAWLQKPLVDDPVNRKMEEQTTDCTFCHEEWLARDEEENEPSFESDGYVVAFVHNGTDLAVIDATEEDHEDCIYHSHLEAMEAAKKLAVKQNMDLYDFSTQ